MSDWKSEEISLVSVIVDKYDLLYTRTGECCRCGQCCSFYDPKTEIQVVCPFLSFDKDGLAVCDIYGTEKYPYVCENFPIMPDLQYDKCTYIFTTK